MVSYKCISLQATFTTTKISSVKLTNWRFSCRRWASFSKIRLIFSRKNKLIPSFSWFLGKKSFSKYANREKKFSKIRENLSTAKI